MKMSESQGFSVVLGVCFKKHLLQKAFHRLWKSDDFNKKFGFTR